MILPKEVATAVYRLINVSSVTSLLNGKIYNAQPRTAVKGQSKKDVTINTLGFTGTDIQEGYIVVNVHCPDIGGLADNLNLIAISKAILNIVDGSYIDTLQSEITASLVTDFEETELAEHYMSIKLYCTNPNY